MSNYIARLRFTRKSDGKVFRAVTYAHWSQIESEDKTETDNVKCIGSEPAGELYVSAQKGHAYTKTMAKS